MKTFNHYPNCDPQKIYNECLADLKKSSRGEKTSFRWIVNQLPEKSQFEENKRIQVLVIGGTVCKSAVVRNQDNNPHILSEIDISKPSFPTGESFLKFVTENINDEVDTVIINVADTIQPVMENGVMDGIFLVSTKENKMEGLLNQKLGQEISKYYLSKFDKKINVHVANDTICLLLSGLTKFDWENLAGGILGTGLNLAIFLNEGTIVNLEAGGYTNLEPSEPGKVIDKNSQEKGEYLFEKETAGGYLYRHFNYWVEKEGMDCSILNTSTQLSEIAQGANKVALLAQEILAYSATLFGCQIAATLQFLGRDTTFVMQGSLFWKGYRYREILEEVVQELVPTLSAEFVQIENADIVGGAKVVM